MFRMATKTVHFELTLRPDGTATMRNYSRLYSGVWQTVGQGQWGHRIEVTLLRANEPSASVEYEILTARLEYIEWLDAYSGNVGVPAVSLGRISDWHPCM